MPISKTVSGLILLEEFDSVGGWAIYTYNFSPSWGSYNLSIDTSDKMSGAGCLLTHYKTWLVGTGSYFCVHKTLNWGTGAGRRAHFWHKNTCSAKQGDNYVAYVIPVSMGQYYAQWNLFSPAPEADPSIHTDWQMHSAICTSYFTGIVDTGVNWADLWKNAEYWGRADKLVVAQSDYFTVTGLTSGQKVEIYRASDNQLMGSAICAGGQTQVSIDINAYDWPLQCYLKIYATDGITLIETSICYEMCAGDTWAWTTGAGTLTLATDAVVIYRASSGEVPAQANVTAQLKTLAGAPYPSKTVTFSTTYGTVVPSSDTTDANGNAHSVMSCPTHGIAVVKANWMGDGSVPACSAYCVIHVFYAKEVGEPSLSFQFYCQGIQYSFVAGHYAWNERGETEDFEIELPEWPSTLTPNGLVGIYRKGIKEFSGILKTYDRSVSDSPRVIVGGSDISFMLDDTVVPIEIYSATAASTIISDLLTKYPSGVTAGVIGVCSTALTLTFDTDTLHEAIDRVCEAVNWHYRVNMDRTLDFAETFTGGMSAAVFEEGVNILNLDRKESFYTVANWIRMKGSGISSTKQDGTKIQADGLHQGVAFQSRITSQATLDAACQALLDMKKLDVQNLILEAVDNYDPYTFQCEDTVTITSPSLDLYDAFPIRRIERDMTQPDLVRMELTNRSTAYWELDESYRRMTKDASV